VCLHVGHCVYAWVRLPALQVVWGVALDAARAPDDAARRILHWVTDAAVCRAHSPR
jgi:hypothetical protein